MRLLGLKCVIASLLSLLFTPANAQVTSQIIQVNNQKLHQTLWSNEQFSATRPTILLLSGPTDNWNSDSAWFARLAPKLARYYQVISIDRAGQFTNSADATLGYKQFGKDMAAWSQQLTLSELHIIAFASSNLSLRHYLHEKGSITPKSIVLIDPDVLTPFSITRYQSDAAPFKQNLEAYQDYIDAGKYDERALQKNQLELAHLKQLAGDDKDIDWGYVSYMFKARLKHENLKNLFAEVAIYGSDLESAAKMEIPADIPLTIFDTDFEQAYIDSSNDQKTKASLKRWQSEGREYFQALAEKSVNGTYIALPTKEHLLPFSDPEQIVQLFNSTKDRN